MERALARTLKILLVLVVVAAAFTFLFAIGGIVRLLLISAIFAYLLDPLVIRIEARGASRTSAVLFLFLGMAIVLGGLLVALYPAVRNELVAIEAGFDLDRTRVQLQNFEGLVEERLAFLDMPGLNLTDRITDLVVGSVNRIFSNLIGLVSVVTNFILTPFVVFFLLKDARTVKRKLVGLVPNRYFEFALNLIFKIDMQLGNYLRGQLLDALSVGILATIALWLLDVKYMFAIGAFAGLANLVPYVGPLAGALAAMLVSLLDTGNLELTVYIGLAFLAVQLIDNMVLQPAIVARNVNLSPLVVLLAILIGGQFFGVLGMLLSVPLAAVLKVVLGEGFQVYRKYNFT